MSADDQLPTQAGLPLPARSSSAVDAPPAFARATGYLRLSAKEKGIFAGAFAGSSYWARLAGDDSAARERYYDAERQLRVFMNDWGRDICPGDVEMQHILVTAFAEAPYFAQDAAHSPRERAQVRRTAIRIALKLGTAFGRTVQLLE